MLSYKRQAKCTHGAKKKVMEVVTIGSTHIIQRLVSTSSCYRRKCMKMILKVMDPDAEIPFLLLGFFISFSGFYFLSLYFFIRKKIMFIRSFVGVFFYILHIGKYLRTS